MIELILLGATIWAISTSGGKIREGRLNRALRRQGPRAARSNRMGGDGTI